MEVVHWGSTATAGRAQPALRDGHERSTVEWPYQPLLLDPNNGDDSRCFDKGDGVEAAAALLGVWFDLPAQRRR